MPPVMREASQVFATTAVPRQDLHEPMQLHAVRLLGDSIPLSAISVHPVFSVPASQPAAVSREQMRAPGRGFDVALMSDQDPLAYVLATDLEDATSLTGDSARPVLEGQRFRGTDDLLSGLTALRQHTWILVARDEGPPGIITRWDLGAPAVSLFFLGLILSLEEALAQLVLSYRDGEILSALSDGRRQRLVEEHARRCEKDSAVRIEDCCTFAHWTEVAGMTAALMADLGLSKSTFKKLTGSVGKLRNHLAHGRTVFRKWSNPERALQVLLELQDVTVRAWALAQNRDQLWDAFEATVLEVATSDGWAVLSQARWDSVRGHADTAAVITACNPRSGVLPDQDNAVRQRSLEQKLDATGVPWHPARGCSSNRKWCEESVLCIGLTREEALALGRWADQHAVFWIEDGLRQVLPCFPEPGASAPARPKIPLGGAD